MSAATDKYLGQITEILAKGAIDTVYMVALSGLFAIIIGLIIGILLFITAPDGVLGTMGIVKLPLLNRALEIIVNVGRSIPFVIIIIAVFPLSKFIVGAFIGRSAAVVPLTIAAAPFVARIVETSFNELGSGIIEAAVASGANVKQIVFRVLLPESAQSLVLGFTITLINLIGYSAMAGTIGGGGLGDVAIRYGYQRFRTDLLWLTIIILIVLVQIIQTSGQMVSRKLDKR